MGTHWQKTVSLPAEFAWLEGRVNYLHRSTANELAGSCPKCGGAVHEDGSFPDRFRIFLKGKLRAWCRRCGYICFPDSETGHAYRPDPALMRAWQIEREQAAETARMRAQATLDVLSRERKWMDYHNNMDDSARALWKDAGIPVSWQDFWQLGYLSERQFEYGGELLTRAALTIPKFDFGFSLRNIDYRLIDPPAGVGKYRPLQDVPAAAYLSTPNESAWRDEVFVVEGSKKAMVTAIWTGPDLRQVVGLPSCNSWAGMDIALRNCGRVWVILDPDATAWANKFALSVGKNARVVELPHKVDDAILKYGLSPDRFASLLRQARKPF
jgi:hypothetical protein